MPEKINNDLIGHNIDVDGSIRMTGKTTREIDRYIQLIFALKPGEKLTVEDTTEKNKSLANTYMFAKLQARMFAEHAFYAQSAFSFHAGSKTVTRRKAPL